MPDPVPAPEQQGDDQLHEDAVESLRQAEAGERPTPREELRMKTIDWDEHPVYKHARLSRGPFPKPEQQGEPLANRIARRAAEDANRAKRLYGPTGEPDEQGEPVCVVCGLAEGASMTEAERRQIEYHPFQPAPPSSEEAEAIPIETLIRAWREDVCDNDADRRSFDQLVAAIRAPLEERVRELEALQEIIDANGHYCDGMALAWSDAQSAEGEATRQKARAEALEEERDRLREALRIVEERASASSYEVERQHPPVTTPQEEAERRWREVKPWTPTPGQAIHAMHFAFVSGAEWLAAEIGLTPEQVQRLGPLVEAARAMYAASEYMDAVDSEDPDAEQWATRMSESMNRYGESVRGLLAAAAALDEEGGE